MRGHNDIILAGLNEADQRKGVQPVVETPDAAEDRLEPLLVGQSKEDRPELGELPHHELVTLAVGLAKEGTGVGERVNDVGRDPAAPEPVIDRFSGLAVPRAGGCVKDQDLL